MSYKNWVNRFFYFILFIFVTLLLISLITDPIKLFHKPIFFKNKFNTNMRLQAAGLINNYEFDSIILGTSILENTSSKEASKLLGGKFINLSLSGSDFYERSYILKYTLKNKKIKNVLYSLDYSGLIFAREGKPDYNIKNFNYLYDNNRFNDLLVYMNLKSFECMFSLAIEPCIGTEINFDMPNEWFSDKSHSGKFGGIDNWFKFKKSKQIDNAFKSILKTTKEKKLNFRVDESVLKESLRIKKYINKYLLEIITKNPKTNFYLVLPPYSIIKNAITVKHEKKNFYLLNKSIKYIIKKTKAYKNIKVYAWGNEKFIENMALYKDLVHYHPKINSLILEWISRDKGLITEQNIEKYFYEFEQKSLKYNLNDVSNKIELFLDKENK